MSTVADSQRWDAIHKKSSSESLTPSDYAREVEKLFPRSSLVVDIGSGTGADALYFLAQGHMVIALDISQFALETLASEAEKKGFSSKIVVRQTDYGLHKIPVKDNSVDVVYSRISLNYFDAEHTARLFADIHRMLKVGGGAFLTLKAPNDPEEMEYLKESTVLFEDNVFIENGMLRSRFTVEQLNQILVRSGVPNARIRYFQENIQNKGIGHSPVLHLNEVTFIKT